MIKKFDICFSPALYPYYSENEKETIVVVVDIFRATTTICAAFAAQAAAVRPVKSLQQAQDAKAQGEIVGAERNADKCDFADFGNSPLDYTPEKLREKTLIFTSTNGTRAIEAAQNAENVLIGAFVNLYAVADFCLKSDKNVLVLCAGWKNRFCIEDTIFGGALAEILMKNNFTANSDSVVVAQNLWQQAKGNIFDFIKNTEHFARLQKRFLNRDIEFCLQMNTINLLPILNKKLNLIVKHK
jgi:2-phosphosulfolactate phosphatase